MSLRIARPKNVALWLIASIALAASTVQAEPSASDRAAARGLFDLGRQLVKDGKFAEACPKFEESLRLDPGSGTRFNLADCYERIGRTATAWTLFLEVASEAKASGQAERQKVARQRATALEPKLPKLSVVVSGDQPDLEVRRDGTVIGRALWGTEVPVDPGLHTIEASAPGKQKWKGTIEVTPSGSHAVTIPTLVPEAGPIASAPPSATASAPPPPPPPSATAPPVGSTTIQPLDALAKEGEKPGGTQRVLGLVTAGVGVVGLGLSTWFTLQAKGKVNDAKDYCNGADCWDSRGVSAHDDARSMADMATVFGVVGALALVGGGVLYLTAPSSRPKDTTATVSRVGVGPSGLVIQGTWQ